MSDINMYITRGIITKQEQAVVEQIHAELTKHQKYFSGLKFDLFYTGGSILRAESPDIDLILFVHSQHVDFNDIDLAISVIFPHGDVQSFAPYNEEEAKACVKSGVLKVNTAKCNLTRNIDILVVLPFKEFPGEYTVENFMSLEYPLSFQMIAKNVLTGQTVTSPLFDLGLLHNVVFETYKIDDKYLCKYKGYYPNAIWRALKEG